MNVERFLEERKKGLKSTLRRTEVCEKELKDFRTLYQNELDGVLDLIELRNKGQTLILSQAYDDLIYNVLEEQSIKGRENMGITSYLKAFAQDCTQGAKNSFYKRRDIRLSGILSDVLDDSSFSRDALEFVKENPNYSVDTKSRIPSGAPALGYTPPKINPTNRRFYDSHSNPSQENGVRELEDALSLS